MTTTVNAAAQVFEHILSRFSFTSRVAVTADLLEQLAVVLEGFGNHATAARVRAVSLDLLREVRGELRAESLRLLRGKS